MKLIIVNHYMKAGGIATALVNLLNSISSDKSIEVTLVLLNDEFDDRYKIPEDVNIITPSKHIRLFSKSYRDIIKRGVLSEIVWATILHFISRILGEQNFLKFLLLFEKKLKGYDIAVSFSNDIHKKNAKGLERKYCGGSNDYVLSRIEANKKIGWVHNEPNELGMTYKTCKKTYEKFDYIAHVSEATKNKFDEIVPEYKKKTVVVYNIIDNERINSLGQAFNPYDDKFVNIVTVARIDNNQKRIDRIINSCEMLLKEGITNYRWTIVGDGPDLKWLEKMAVEKGVNNFIKFIGLKDNPYPYIKYADFLVMTSHHEAHSMVLLEATALNTPIICTNYASASEIVRNGINGLLVENNTEGIYVTVKKLLSEYKKLNEIKDKAMSNKDNNSVALKQFYDIMTCTTGQIQ